MMLKGQQCEKCKNDYASQLQTTNQQQSNHYKQLMPGVFQVIIILWDTCIRTLVQR